MGNIPENLMLLTGIITDRGLECLYSPFCGSCLIEDPFPKIDVKQSR